MHEKIIIAGFGGQGILFSGKLLCQAGLEKGLYVTYLPSYGAEVRGGTAHCHVILSSNAIASPVISNPTLLMIMNEPSLIKFESRLVPNGLFILNTSLINRKISRNDINILSIPATDMANDLGNARVANMIMLGSYLAYKEPSLKESVVRSLPTFLSSGKESLVDINIKAIELGYNYSLKKVGT